jgi:RNA polymerase sigma-70 factor (ECF subfamily)
MIEWDSKPDSELLRLMRCGSQTAMEEVYRRYLPSVWRYVYSRVDGDRYAAEDVVSETFLAAVDSLKRLDPDSGPIYPWLIGIVRHKLQDWRRLRRRMSGSSETDCRLVSPVDSANPQDGLEAAESRRRIVLAMIALSDDERIVLEWKYIEGLTVREIADRTGRTEKAVENVLYRARRAFRMAFQEPEEDNGHDIG